MPYTRITPCRNGRESIYYALGGIDAKGHNGNEARNLLVGSVNMLPSEIMEYADQMEIFWLRASSRNKTQTRRIITSYSKEELDPEDPHSPEIALAIHQEHARKAYPGRQALICVQADGIGGCLHVHEIINNVSMVDEKGCTTEQTKYFYVARTVDEIAKEYVTLSMAYEDKFDKKTGKVKVPDERITQNERRMREDNDKDAIEGDEPTHYIWKDDLKARVLAAMAEATSRDDFLKRLKDHDVEGEYRYSKKQGPYIIYELTNTDNFPEGKPPRRLKSKSYKLGADYDLEALDAAIQRQAETPTSSTSEKQAEPETATQPELTPQEKEAQQREREEIERFRIWSEENGYSWYDENGRYKVMRAAAAKKAYKEAQEKQRQQQEQQSVTPPIEPEKPAHEPAKAQQEDDLPEMKISRKAPVSTVQDAPKEDIQQEPVTNPIQQPIRSALMQKIIDDIEDADRKEIAEEWDEPEEPKIP